MEEHPSSLEAVKRWPWYVTVGFALLMAMGAGGFSLFGDPEAVFWRKVGSKKMELRLQNFASKDSPRVFVGGGSSCSFSIHPDVLEEVTGMPAANVGGSAAMGYRYLIWLAIKEARDGDVVILHLEPDILRGRETESSVLAAKVDFFGSFAKANAGALAGKVFEDPLADRLSAIRPGAKLIGTVLAKVASRRPLYLYRVEDLQPSGVLTTAVSDPNSDVEPFAPMAHWLDEDVAADLRLLADYGKKEGISIFYTLPWECFHEEALLGQREEHARYLNQLEKWLPVLRDEKMGAVSDNSWFLDTGYHMTLESGRYRTRLLGEALNRELKKSR